MSPRLMGPLKWMYQRSVFSGRRSPDGNTAATETGGPGGGFGIVKEMASGSAATANRGSFAKSHAILYFTPGTSGNCGSKRSPFAATDQVPATATPSALAAPTVSRQALASSAAVGLAARMASSNFGASPTISTAAGSPTLAAAIFACGSAAAVRAN